MPSIFFKSNLNSPPSSSSSSTTSSSAASNSRASHFGRVAATVIMLNSTVTPKNYVDYRRISLPRTPLPTTAPNNGVGRRMTAASTASRIFGFDAAAKSPPYERNNAYDNFHAISARRRNSASVAPPSVARHLGNDEVLGAALNYRHVKQPPTFSAMSASNSAGAALSAAAAASCGKREGISLDRNNNSTVVRNNNDISSNSSDSFESETIFKYGNERVSRRRESKLHDYDSGGGGGNGACNEYGNSGCLLPYARGGNYSLQRSSTVSSTENSNSSSSPPYSGSSGSASSATIALNGGGSKSTTTIADYGIGIIASNDEKNHPNEKIIKHSNCVEKVSSRLAFYRLYEFGGLIGQGNFSNVHVVYAESSGVKYAVKGTFEEIDKLRMNGKTYFVENEIAILKKCVHRNICRLFDAFQCEKYYFLVFEYAQKGDLFETIKRMSHLSERTTSQITYQIASALHYLHGRRIVHRDVKPENILLGANLCAKLTDFGLACSVMGPLYRVCGTPTYVAPEVLTQEGYSVEVDVWSLGVLMYVMLIGFAPFRCADRGQLFRLIVKAKVSFDMPSWSRISSKAKQLITLLLTPKPMLRLKSLEVMNNEWIRIYNDPRDRLDDVR